MDRKPGDGKQDIFKRDSKLNSKNTIPSIYAALL